jgi:hypothetical protein
MTGTTYEQCLHCGRPLITRASRGEGYHGKCRTRLEEGIARVAVDFTSAQLAKAANALATGRIDYRPGGVSFVLGMSGRTYRTTSLGCSCPAHIPCWHMATVRLRDLSPGPDVSNPDDGQPDVFAGLSEGKSR